MSVDGITELVTPAHELGHAFLRLEAGCVVDSVRVGDGLGFFDWGMAGVCHWTWPSGCQPTEREKHLLLAGCLAGFVAEERFRAERGYPPYGDASSEDDYGNFHEMRQAFDLGEFSEQGAESLAGEVLARCWQQLLDTVPLLAERGRLTGRAL